MSSSKITILKEFLEQSPGDSFLQHALALEYLKTGQDEEAQIVFEKLLSADPDYTGSYYQLGKLYEKRGQIEKATEAYERGIVAARKEKSLRAQNELQSALDELLF